MENTKKMEGEETTPEAEEKAPAEGEDKEAAAEEQPASIVDKAEAIAKRIEEANKKTEQLVLRQEKVAAQMLLAGKTDAGTEKKSEDQENTEKVDKEVEETIGMYN